MQYIKTHALDNVAVTLMDLVEDTEVSVDNQAVTLRQDVTRGHKFALTDIAKGASVIKYGLPIGYALADTAAGEHTYARNTRTNLSDLDQYRYQPGLQDLPAQAANREVQIYHRANGDVGVRSELQTLPTMDYVDGIAWQIQNRFLKKTNNAEGTDGVLLLSHTYGCSQLGNDRINTCTVSQNMVHHPNADAVLVTGLGCENNQVAASRGTLDDIGPERVHFMTCQQQDDEIETGIAYLHRLYSVMRNDERKPDKLSELKFGLEYGGSDSPSGITASPMLGRFFSYVIVNGGTTVLTEVSEMLGTEQLLMNHRHDETMFERLVAVVNGFKQYFVAHNRPIYENPSPGNKADGIIALEDRSLSYTQKAGISVVVGVLRYGRRLRTPGLSLLSASGNDAIVTNTLAGAGYHMVLFSANRGTPYGGSMPTVKIAANSKLVAKKEHWIDLDAGQLIHGKTMPQSLEEFIDTIARFTSDKRTCNERNDFHKLATLRSDATL